MKRLVSILMLCVLATATVSAQVNKAQNHVRTKADIVKHIARHMNVAKSSDNGSKDVISTFPYIQGFENGMDGWTVYDADGDSSNWFIATMSGYGHSGNCFIMSESYSETSYDALTPDNWLVSPAIQLPSSDSISLLWYVRPVTTRYPADNYTVYITTGDGQVASFTNAATGAVLYGEVLDSSMTDYQSREVSLAAYAGQTVHIAFRHHNCTDEYAMLLDDITLVRTGAPVATIFAPNFTYVGTTLQLDANLVSGDTSNMTYAWSIAGATPATASTSQISATWSAAGLYRVRLTVSNSVGSCSDSMLVRVYDCTGSVITFPYTEDFEYGIGCWQVTDADGDGYDWEVLESHNYAHSGSGYLSSQSYNDDGALTPDNWIVSPAFQLPSGALELSWFVKPEAEYYPEEKYSVYVSTTGASISDFTTVLFTETLTGFSDYQRRIVPLSAYAGQTIRVAFRHYDCEDQWAIDIDDVTIGQPGAPMASISGPRVIRTCDSIAAFTAEVSTTLPVSSFNWSITPAGATLVSGATDSMAQFDISQATAGIYTVTYIVSNANGSDTATAALRVIECEGTLAAPFTENFAYGLGCWGTIDADGDGYNWESIADAFDRIGVDNVSQYCYSDSNALVSWSYYPTGMSFFGVEGDSLNCNDILVSPAIQLASGQSWNLAFYAMSLDESYPDGLEVKIATSFPRQLSDFTVSLMPRMVLTDSVYRRFVYNLNQYAGQSIYIGFIHQDNNKYGLLLDDVSVTGEVTGIDGVEPARVLLFPNPTTGNLSIQAEGLRQIEVLDANGRKVLSSVNGQINMSTLSSGIYMVRVMTTEGVSIHKILKK